MTVPETGPKATIFLRHLVGTQGSVWPWLPRPVWPAGYKQQQHVQWKCSSSSSMYNKRMLIQNDCALAPMFQVHLQWCSSTFVRQALTRSYEPQMYAYNRGILRNLTIITLYPWLMLMCHSSVLVFMALPIYCLVSCSSGERARNLFIFLQEDTIFTNREEPSTLLCPVTLLTDHYNMSKLKGHHNVSHTYTLASLISFTLALPVLSLTLHSVKINTYI